MVNKYTYMEMFTQDINRQINLNEFEKCFKIPHQTVKRHLDVLLKEGILNEKKLGKFLFYSVNKENSLFFECLSICEKQRLIRFLEENALFKRLYNVIHNELKNNKILIFGSSVDSKKYEDIDILILSKDKKIRKLLRDFEDTYSVKFHIIQTNEKNLTKTLLNEIKKNHIIISEHDYFLRLMHEN